MLVSLFKRGDKYKELAETFFENLSQQYLVSGIYLLELRFILRKYGMKDEDIEKAMNSLFSFKN